MDNLYTALSEFDDTQAKQVKTYSGLLGLPTSNKTVEVPNRNGYVYVRLRDNQSEIIQAFNEKVSPVYNLPVIVTRQGNRWIVVNRDIERYENWGSYSAFVPAHAHQHEFNRSDLGGDIVFSYIDQIQPLLVYPSGTPGSSNVLVGGYSFKKNDSTWAYVGNTGTPSVLIYRPTDNQARMVLIYLDRNTGNPGMLVNSGTSFAANLTGTHDVLQYLPSLTSTQEPLKAIRLVSGTEYVGWENLYDIRQFLGGNVTGTGGGSATPGGSNTQVQYNDNSAFNGDSGLVWYETENCLIVGDGNAPPAVGTNSMHLLSDATSPGFYLWAASSNFSVAPFIAGLRGRGTIASPSTIQANDYIFRLRARAYDGTEWTGTQAEILFDAPYDWISGSHPTRIGMWATPSGSAVMEEVLRVTTAGPDIRNAKTYNINGSPHGHNYISVLGGHGNGGTVVATGTNYIAPFLQGILTSNLSTPWPIAGTLKNLTVRLASAQPATGSLVITVAHAAAFPPVDTALSVIITGGTPAGTYRDLVNTSAFTAGNLLQIKFTNNATSVSGVLGGVTFQLESPTT